MSRRLAPPIHLLRAFITTARVGTISSAAEVLHLTQGAVSKQVQDLEEWLGVLLFERVRKRLQLTPAGQRYLLAVRPLLVQLDAATLELMSHPEGDAALHLSTLPSFGAKWLIPRLPGFQALHPRTTLHFVPYVEGYDFHRPDLDCAIRFGNGSWPGAESVYVVGRAMTLIAPPPARGERRVRRPSDVRHFNLLQHTSVPTAWSQWFAHHGVSGANPDLGTQFDQYQTLIRAVAAGMGLGLVPACLVQQELAHHEVMAPLPDDDYQAETGYFLCYPPARARMPALAAFRDWLLRQAQGEPQAAPHA